MTLHNHVRKHSNTYGFCEQAMKQLALQLLLLDPYWMLAHPKFMVFMLTQYN